MRALGLVFFSYQISTFFCWPLALTTRSSEQLSRVTLFSLLWWSIPPVGEGHSHKALWSHANCCMKCFLRPSFLYIIPQLSTSLYPSGGHGQLASLAPP